MKKVTIIIAAIIMIAGFSSKMMAQNEITTNAAAKIVSALTVSNHDGLGLHFGTMTRPTAATTVIVPPTGARTDGGNIVLLAQTPTYHAASYDVSGDGTATYHIYLPSADVTINSGANSMIVNTFTSSKGVANNGTLVGGVDAFTVGATLHLVLDQPAGEYIGTYDVSVAYN
jgi:outer membrane lipoprotein-sorting protein